MPSLDLPRPPFDAEIAPMLGQFPGMPADMDREALLALRKNLDEMVPPELVLSDPTITYEDRVIPGPHGDIALGVFRSKASAGNGGSKPGILHIHGGGMFCGNRFVGMAMVIPWVKEYDAVAVSVEYRLAPENQGTVPVEDCYAALKWMGEHLDELGVDPEKLMVAGSSSGGGLAAGTALMARDKRGPKLFAQLLACPMLDDRNETVSSKQFTSGGTWNRSHNLFGWKCLLGERSGGSDVSIYAAPARATDLSGLPPAFIDVGSAEPFRDEDVAYATKLWAAGVQAELHVWPGCPHAFDGFMPTTAIAKVAVQTRNSWVRRILKKSPDPTANAEASTM